MFIISHAIETSQCSWRVIGLTTLTSVYFEKKNAQKPILEENFSSLFKRHLDASLANISPI